MNHTNSFCFQDRRLYLMFKIHMYSSPYLLLYYDDNHIHLYQISQLFLLKKIHLKTSYYSILIRARRSHMIYFNQY